ncbi:MAG: hypothetical protein ABI634_16105 [Acidobacteriota bacterium]
MVFPVEVVLKGRDFAVTENAMVPTTEPPVWDDAVVRAVLVEILKTMSRVEDAKAAEGREVILQGFSWIVEPSEGQVVIAIEIPMGAAVAGPFAVPQAELDATITRVLRTERQFLAPNTIH